MEELKLMHISVAFLLMRRSSPWGKCLQSVALLHRHSIKICLSLRGVAPS